MKLFHPNQYFVYPEEQELYQIYSTVVLKVLYSQTNLKGKNKDTTIRMEKRPFWMLFWKKNMVSRNCTFRYQRCAKTMFFLTKKDMGAETPKDGFSNTIVFFKIIEFTV